MQSQTATKADKESPEKSDNSEVDAGTFLSDVCVCCFPFQFIFRLLVLSVCRCAIASRACVDNFDFMSKAFVIAVVHMKPNVQSDQIEITCKQNDGRNRRTGTVDA